MKVKGKASNCAQQHCIVLYGEISDARLSVKPASMLDFPSIPAQPDG